MILYKYLPAERLDVLERAVIRFTQPVAFNDPFECDPRPFDRDELSWTNDCPHPECLDAHVSTTQHHLNLSTRSSCGLLCLSEVPDNLLMWAHYAGDHAGIVIGFDANHSYFLKSAVSSGLCQVAYRNRRPTRPIAQVERELARQPGPHEFGLTNFAINFGDYFEPDLPPDDYRLVKSEDWSYEREWRVVRSLGEPSEVLVLPSRAPVFLFSYPRDAVKCVIIGCRAFATLYPTVRQILDRHPEHQHAQVIQAAPSDQRFAVILEPFELGSLDAEDVRSFSSRMLAAGVLIPFAESEYVGARYGERGKAPMTVSGDLLRSIERDLEPLPPEDMKALAGPILAMQWAQTLSARGEWEEAVKYFEKSLETHEEKLSRTPDDLKTRAAYVENCMAYARVALEKGETTTARRSLERAQESFSQLRSAQRSDHRLALSWANSLVVLAQLENEPQQEARPRIAEAMTLLDSVAPQELSEASDVEIWADVNAQIGYWHNRVGDVPNAVDRLQHAVRWFRKARRSKGAARGSKQEASALETAALSKPIQDGRSLRRAWSCARHAWTACVVAEPNLAEAKIRELRALTEVARLTSTESRHSKVLLNAVSRLAGKLVTGGYPELIHDVALCCASAATIGANGGRVEEAKELFSMALHACSAMATSESFADTVAVLRAEILLDIAELTTSTNDLEEGDVFLKEAVALIDSPSGREGDPGLWLKRGHAKRRYAERLMREAGAYDTAMHLLQDAAGAYERSHQLAPNASWAKNGLGIALLRQGELLERDDHSQALTRWYAAREAFEEELRLNPTSAVGFQNLGNVWMLLGSSHGSHDSDTEEHCFQMAAEAYDRSYALRPQSEVLVSRARAMAMMSGMFMDTDRYDEYAAVAEDVINICEQVRQTGNDDPLLVTAHVNALAFQVVMNRSEPKLARRYCERALDILDAAISRMPGAGFETQRTAIATTLLSSVCS
jgi:tetratricopeptide (TPR) repeat protein